MPRLEALLGLWRKRYESQPIPDRSRFAGSELGPWARHVAWIDALPGDRHRIREFGIELIRRFGREATNHCVEDLALDIATGLRRQLDRTIATAAPVFGAASVQLGRDAAVFCDLVLPVAAAGGRVNQFLFASYELRKPLDMAVG
ncbi:MAG: hypothetical protein WB709_06505 [Solirubrobacteraceae bacterium]